MTSTKFSCCPVRSRHYFAGCAEGRN